ncbi:MULTISPECIES: acyl carrier protein [Nocardia]|uniref:acyl carrier protein n=1 Tax=Nocardia TaxID=1817 RepID=UPI0013005B59|nr:MULTISPECIES: acyl carrier protein [Nocardia]
MSDEITERVGELFRAGLQVAYIDVDTPLLDYGLDSVRSAEIVIELERAFGVELLDEEVATLHTARDVIDCVSAKYRSPTEVGA